MRLGELMQSAVEAGMEEDYRGREVSLCSRQEEAARAVELAGLKGQTAERVLRNWPVYGDEGLNVGDLRQPVRRVLAGIDITPEALVKAKRLNGEGWGVDLLFAHHPLGRKHNIPRALNHLLRLSVLELHARSLASFFDMPLSSAQRIHALNHKKLEKQRAEVPAVPSRPHMSIELAETFGIALYSCHTPCDNHLFWGIQETLRQQPRTVGDFVDAVLAIPEYARFRRERLEVPEVVSGSRRALLGRAWNADTQCLISCLSEEVIAEIAKAGFSSVVGVIGGLHGGIGSLCRKYQLNAVHLPHDPSDNLGINRLLDKLAKVQPLDVLCTGDFFRVERK